MKFLKALNPFSINMFWLKLAAFSLKLPPSPFAQHTQIHVFEGKPYLVREYTLPPAVVHFPDTPGISWPSMYCWRFPRPYCVWYVCSLEIIKLRSYLRSKIQICFLRYLQREKQWHGKCRHASSRTMENKLTLCIVSIIWVTLHSQGFIKFRLRICVHCVHVSSFFLECL